MNDLDTNNGFPLGMTAKDLKPGILVRVMFEDQTDLVPALVTQVDNHAHNYKGERDCRIVSYCGTTLFEEGIVHTQIRAFYPSELFRKFLTSK